MSTQHVYSALIITNCMNDINVLSVLYINSCVAFNRITYIRRQIYI